MMQDLANSILKYYSWCDDVMRILNADPTGAGISGDNVMETLVIEGHSLKGQQIINTMGFIIYKDLIGYAHWLNSATDED